MLDRHWELVGESEGLVEHVDEDEVLRITEPNECQLMPGFGRGGEEVTEPVLTEASEKNTRV